MYNYSQLVCWAFSSPPRIVYTSQQFGSEIERQGKANNAHVKPSVDLVGIFKDIGSKIIMSGWVQCRLCACTHMASVSIMLSVASLDRKEIKYVSASNSMPKYLSLSVCLAKAQDSYIIVLGLTGSKDYKLSQCN